MFKTAIVVSFLLMVAGGAHAEVVGQFIDYRHGDVLLQGYLAYDNAVATLRPGVLVVHEWWGLNDYPKQRARQLAELGYVAFAADIYGKGVVATTPEEAGKLAGAFYANRELYAFQT
ncbi:MAG: dienelactone hydrolase family protein, partial [Myxococcales bacterium]